MKRGRALLPELWLFALGAALVILLLIPQLSLYPIYALVACALLSLIAVLVLLRHSMRLSLVFALLMAGLGYLFEVEEGAMLLLDACAGAVALLIIKDARPNLFLRIALACVLGVIVLIVGTAFLPMLRKGMAVLEALRYGLAHQWPTLIAALAGSLVAGLCFTRKPA